MYLVRYRIKGSDVERFTPAYATMVLAQAHADDIAGYEGIEYAFVESDTSNKAFDRYVEEKLKSPTFAAEYEKAGEEIEKKTADEGHAWDLYVAAAMSSLVANKNWIDNAAKYADQMLLQRRKRFK